VTFGEPPDLNTVALAVFLAVFLAVVLVIFVAVSALRSQTAPEQQHREQEIRTVCAK